MKFAGFPDLLINSLNAKGPTDGRKLKQKYLAPLGKGGQLKHPLLQHYKMWVCIPKPHVTVKRTCKGTDSRNSRYRATPNGILKKANHFIGLVNISCITTNQKSKQRFILKSRHMGPRLTRTSQYEYKV